MNAYAASYDLVQPESAPAERSEDDLLLANWNPALAALAAFRDNDAGDRARSARGASSVEADPDGFLDLVYALASHV